MIPFEKLKKYRTLVLCAFILSGLAIAGTLRLVIGFEYFNTTYDSASHQMRIAWETKSESDVAGFNIYRSTSENKKGVKVNPVIIVAMGSPTTGAAYEFKDEPDSSGRYYYKLAEVSLTSGLESTYFPDIDDDGEPHWDDFVKVFADTQDVVGTDYYWFNADSGDGHPVSIIITSAAFGTINVEQVNATADSLPGSGAADWYWKIDSDISALASIDFFYQLEDLHGVAENNRFLGLAKWQPGLQRWSWQQSNVYSGEHKVRLDNEYPLGTFVFYTQRFGDVNGDGIVNETDLNRFTAVWQQTTLGEFEKGSDSRFFNYSKTETDGMQIIDAADFQELVDNWQTGSASGADSTRTIKNKVY